MNNKPNGTSRMQYWLMSGLLIACLGLLTLQSRGQDSETAFEGKPISFWLHQYESTYVSNEPEKVAAKKEAEIAVRSIGTNAIPMLLKMVAKGASWPHGRPKVNIDAIDGFEILGASASNAVPALVTIFEDSPSPSAQATAALALAGIGSGANAAISALMRTATNSDSRIRSFAFRILTQIPASHKQVIPVATQALSDTNFLVKVAAMDFLDSCGSEAESATPALVEQSTNANWRVRCTSCSVLGSIRSIPDITVPALVVRLADPVPLVRKTAAWALGNFRTSARQAVPALDKLSNDTNSDVRLAAAEAVKKITREKN